MNMNESFNFLIRLVLFNSFFLIVLILSQNESKKDPFSTQSKTFSLNFSETLTSFSLTFQLFAFLFLLK